MKTTFDLPAALVADVKALAREERTTARSLVEEALRRLLDEHRAQPSAYVLPDTSVGGDGLAPEFEVGGWPALRAAAYGDRG